MKLREIYSISFELPDRPGYWTSPEGRYLSRNDAVAYAKGTRATKFDVLITLLMPGERPRQERGRPLKVVLREALEILKELTE